MCGAIRFIQTRQRWKPAFRRMCRPACSPPAIMRRRRRAAHDLEREPLRHHCERVGLSPGMV